jgi:opacity protein-like surface antigen
VRALAVAVIACLSLTPGLGVAGGWTLGLRGGYAWPTLGGSASEGPGLAAVASHPWGNEAAGFLSVGYLGITGPSASFVCPAAPGAAFPCDTRKARRGVTAVAAGLRLGGEREDGRIEPWWEVAPAVFYSRWEDGTHLVPGWQASFGVPFAVSDRWSLHAGLAYSHAASHGLQQVQFLGGLSRRMGPDHR